MFDTLNAQKDHPKPGLYRHYKGSEYRVFGTARHSETEEWHVIYQALYGEKGFWLRPLSMFTECVERAEKPVPRFARIND